MNRISESNPESYYKQLAEILAGENFKQGSCLPSIRDLAVTYKVSPATVRKAVVQLVSEGKLRSRWGKGVYLTKKYTRSRKKTNCIGIITPYQTEMPGGIYDSTIYQNLNTIASNSHYNLIYKVIDFHGNTSYKNMFNNFQLVDGLLIISPRIDHHEKLYHLASKDTPFIILGGCFPKSKILNYIDSDNVEGAFTTTEYLINLGHRKIGFLTEHFCMSNFTDRLKGYKKALKKHGIKFDPKLIYEGIDTPKKMVDTHPLPSAIITMGEGLTISLMEAVKSKNLRIPDDISIIGYDDTAYANHLHPPLTTVKQPLNEMCKVAIDKLIPLIDGKKMDQPIHIKLKQELIIRKSCSSR